MSILTDHPTGLSWLAAFLLWQKRPVKSAEPVGAQAIMDVQVAVSE